MLKNTLWGPLAICVPLRSTILLSACASLTCYVSSGFFGAFYSSMQMYGEAIRVPLNAPLQLSPKVARELEYIP